MLNEIIYELEHILISKKLKKIGFISIRKSLGRVELLGQSALAMCQSALQECQQALLGAGLAFEFWSNLDSFLRVFEPGIAPRRVFNSYSKN